MSHEISNAAYSVRPAWHGLGVVLPYQMTVPEALEAARLNWTPERLPVVTSEGVRVEGHRAIVRSDTRAPLGLVSDRYRVIPHSVLGTIAQTVTEIAPGSSVEAALELRGGREIVLLVNLGSWSLDGGQDPSEDYLCLATAHDGTGALRAFPTSVRVVCKNTLVLSEARDASRILRVSHHGDNVEARVGDLEQAVSFAAQGLSEWQELARRFAGWHLSDEEAAGIIMVATELQSPRPEPEAGEDALRSWRQRADATAKRILECPSLAQDDSTGWALFNKVTSYWQHYRGANETRVRRSIEPGSRDSIRKRTLVSAMGMMLDGGGAS